jgi:chromosome segregation ATPase
MQELIKYFEAIEARLASLEATEQSLREKEQMLQAWEERLQILEKAQQEHMTKLQAVGTHVTAMLQMLKQLEAKPRVEEPEMEEPKVEEPRVEEVTPKASIYGKAVTEIRQAISIGDRFLYQRELFEQNAELMQRTLNELDQLNSFSEAMDYINMHFHWNQESNTYQQFIVTLHRRFG